MLNIDFFSDARTYIENKGKDAPAPAAVTPVHIVSEPKKLVEPPKAEPPKQTKTFDLFPEVKGFTVSEDCKTLTLNGTTYTIPDFYNKEMIAIRDKKTLDMVFISLGLEY